MCASYGLQITAEDIHYGFSVIDDRSSMVALSGWLEEFRDEAAKPTGVNRRNLNPIIREREKAGEHRRTVDLAWWKLWIGKAPAKFPAINARVEGLVGSGAWGAPLKSRRALVPATEYYEKGHRFELPDEPNGLFAFAGLWNVAKTSDPTTGDDEWMLSYAIVTQPASSHIASIHDRMPLILPRDLYDEWLDPERVGDQNLLDDVVAESRSVSERLKISEGTSPR
ncbi:MAG: SOS response-associated peptidase family protein [Pseudolysinimonas sp.]|uniref:SOS response-associated peptidase family protein n=1 Tax=Pseudolysinimonas sp. TaxID=2680009 RepID=UPI00326416A6